MISQDQVQAGMVYSYTHQGAEKTGVLIGTPLTGKIKMAEFDNGDKLPLSMLMKLGDVILDGNLDDLGQGSFDDDYERMMQREAMNLNEEDRDIHDDDDEPEIIGLSEEDLKNMSEEENIPLDKGNKEKRQQREPDPTEYVNIPIRTDENGVPVLQFEGDENAEIEGDAQVHQGSAAMPGRNTQPAQDPIIALLSKASYQKSKIDIKLEIEMMDPDAFGILAKAFPDSTEAMIDYFVNKITIHDVRALLREHFSNHYKVTIEKSKTE